MPSFSNQDELFDVVDDQDRVVAQAPRREVHARNLLHRAVHVLAHNATGEVFLQRRSFEKDSFPGCWDASCTGHLDAGEDYLTAARRELGEELGWFDASQPLRPVAKLPASPSTGHEFIEIYLLGPIEGPFDLNPEEIIDGRWVGIPKLIKELRESPEQFSGAFRHLMVEHGAAILALLSRSDLGTV